MTRLRHGALIALTLVLMTLLLLLPLGVIFTETFSRGLGAVLGALTDPDAIDAIRLTLTVAAVSVPLNAICGTAAAWCIGRFDFPGRTLLTTLIELPFSVSPVISGLVWVLLFGANGWFGSWLDRHEVRIIFALLCEAVAGDQVLDEHLWVRQAVVGAQGPGRAGQHTDNDGADVGSQASGLCAWGREVP